LVRNMAAVATPVERQRSLAFAPASHPLVSEPGGQPHDRCLGGMTELTTPRTTSSRILAFEVPVSGSARTRTARGHAHRTPLLGFVSPPPPTCPACVHSHDLERPLRPEDANPPVTFRPRGFSPPRRLPPHTSPRDIALRCRTGVRRVSPTRRALGPARRLSTPTSHSQSASRGSPRRFTPLEDHFPSTAASVSPRRLALLRFSPVPCAAGRLRWTQPATRHSLAAPGPCSVDGIGRPTPPMKAAQTPHLPWALFPLQGLDDDAGTGHPLTSDVEHAHPWMSRVPLPSPLRFCARHRSGRRAGSRSVRPGRVLAAEAAR
jgi:hypothetical protein